MKVNKQSPAKGTEGFLLIYPDMSTAVDTGKKNKLGQRVVECQDTVVVFRIYERDEFDNVKKNEKGHAIFKDYEILHHDLRVKLLDGQFYETDEGNYIDYPGLRRYGSETNDSDAPRPEDAQG